MSRAPAAGPATVSQSAQVVRWLCHDMATPISTLLTASELLSDTGDQEINDLITAAIRRLSARLRLVRLAMGSRSMTMATGALEKLLAEALPDTQVALALPEDAALPASLVAGAALILSEVAARAPLAIDGDGARWTGGQALPALVLNALAGTTQSDARSAMIALVAEQVHAGGWTFEPAADGLNFRPMG